MNVIGNADDKRQGGGKNNYDFQLYIKHTIFFLSTRLMKQVEKCAKECSEYAHTRHWVTGLFTNAANLFGSETRLPDCAIFFSTRGECGTEFFQIS